MATSMTNFQEQLAHIVQTAAAADKLVDKINLLVDSVHKVLTIDACSLYLANAEGEMQLYSSWGLAEQTVQHPRLPLDQGLVGLVAASRHPLNISDAEAHPNYCMAEMEEDSFHGFCGVPLVQGTRVVGVLVARTHKLLQFNPEEEVFLVTLAAHLILLLVAANWNGLDETPINNRLNGIKGAPGIAVGQVRLVHESGLQSVTDIQCTDIDTAIAQWHELLVRVRDSVQWEKDSIKSDISDSVSSVFTVYQMVLNDPVFIERVESSIKGGLWLPAALRNAVQHFSDVFQGMEDPYFRARHEDVLHLGNKLFNTWQGFAPPSTLPEGAIVLAGPNVSVSDIAAIPVDRLVGIVCFAGSSMSHTAILANALDIPAVMGTGVIHELENDRAIIVDGDNATVWLDPETELLAKYQRQVEDHHFRTRRLATIRELPAITLDGVAMTLYANTGLLSDVMPGLASGAQGVGLYRTEIPFMAHPGFPTEDEQLIFYRHVLEAYRGMPVYMRTLDIGGDKQLPYFPIEDEANPALGWRGIRFSLDNSPLLMTQVRAMLRASAGLDNLRILIPMVSSRHELEEFHGLLSDALAQLQAEGYLLTRPELGVMIEVPAAISQVASWRDQIDFVSIGSNDLTQYLLAVDRGNPRVAGRYDHLHPAVLREINRLLGITSELDLPVCVCGEMAADIEAVVLL
ncbi:MAG: phosphoenolpyruvate-protein phosphotransferase, partial [Halieaceae bacterium]